MGYILFSSPRNIYLYTAKTWDGIIEYSYNNQTWNVYKGGALVNNQIYMRGINNTVISSNSAWLVNGESIKCQGNIENLLDYKSVINNIHPIMQEYCFGYMFYTCYSLIEAPQLPFELTNRCCWFMFCNCKALYASPLFCHFSDVKEAISNQHMFHNCPIKF